MKKKNLFTSLCVSMVAAMMLVGCGAKASTVTMEEVAEKMNETEVNSGVAVISGTFQYGYLENKEAKTIDMNIAMEMQWTDEPLGMYLKQSVEMNTDDNILENMDDTNIEMYIVEEDGSYALYQGIAGEQWNHLSLDNIEEYASMISKTEGTLNAKSFTEEQLKTTCTNENASVNGRPAYEFIYTGTFDEVEKILDGIMSGISDIIDLSITDKEIVVTIYIDKETYYPLSSTVELTSKTNLDESSETNAQMWIGDCKVSVNYSKINEIETITVPENVKKEAVDFSDLLDDWFSEW